MITGKNTFPSEFNSKPVSKYATNNTARLHVTEKSMTTMHEDATQKLNEPEVAGDMMIGLEHNSASYFLC